MGKLIRKIEEIILFKSLFELSRYLNRLPRYKDSKSALSVALEAVQGL